MDKTTLEKMAPIIEPLIKGKSVLDCGAVGVYDDPHHFIKKPVTITWELT